METGEPQYHIPDLRKTSTKKLERSLIDEIENIKASSEINIELLEEKNSLENLRKEKLQGHIIRSRARWVEDGKKILQLRSKNIYK